MTDYTTDDTPLDPKQRRILTDQQRYALIDQFFITHYRLFPVFEEFERMAAQAREAETWIPYGLALLGESGVGKTAAVQHWMKTAPMYRDTSLPEEQKAYMYISLSAPTTSKALLAGMLRMLEDPSWNRGTHGMRNEFSLGSRASLGASFVNSSLPSCLCLIWWRSQGKFHR